MGIISGISTFAEALYRGVPRNAVLNGRKPAIPITLEVAPRPYDITELTTTHFPKANMKRTISFYDRVFDGYDKMQWVGIRYEGRPNSFGARFAKLTKILKKINPYPEELNKFFKTFTRDKLAKILRQGRKEDELRRLKYKPKV